jgi:hypothetical protein
MSSTRYRIAPSEPKGGKDRALTIPLSSECLPILARRGGENREIARTRDHAA